LGTGIAKATEQIVPEPTGRFAEIAPALIPAAPGREEDSQEIGTDWEAQQAV
jgi:hypothetical protein